MADLSGSIADLRASGHKVIVNFSTFVGAQVMEATIDSAPTLPAANLTITNVSGSHTDVTAGMRVDIETSSGDLKGRTRVRFAGTISAVNLPIRETSDGSIDIQATDVVKVYEEYRLSDKLVEASGDFDPDQISYVAQGSDPPPVACSGGPWFGEIDPYYENVQLLNPIAYYRLNEKSGNTAADSSGNGYDGTTTGATVNQQGNGDGTSYLFDGSGDDVTLPAWFMTALDAAISGGGVTVGIWAKVDAGFWTEGVRRDFFRFAVDGSNEIYLEKLTTNDTLQYVYEAGGTPVFENVDIGSPTAWMFLLITIDIINDVVRLYHNGAQVGSDQTGFGSFAGDIAIAHIGSRDGSTRIFDGNIAHVAVWDRVLTAAEISSISSVTPQTILMAGSASYTADPDSGGSVTHLWTLPDGVLFASGSSSTDANPTLEVEAGTYIITHAVTDSSNSEVTTQYVPVRVHDSSDPPLECMVESMEAELSGGWSATVRLFSSATLASIPDGTLCAIWVSETINGTVQSFGNASSGHSHIKLVGYLRRDDDDREAEEEQLTFEIISPLSRLDELLGLSKVMLREASPDAWSELKTLTVKRAIIQIVQFYSTLIESGYDFIFHSTFSDKDFPAFYLQKASPAAQIRELGDALDNRLICDRAGRFEVQLRLELQALASRGAETTTLTLSTDDIIKVTVAREHWRPLELYRARGFTAGTTVADTQPVFSKWPGDAPGVGNQQTVQERLIVDDVSDLYDRTGRRGALEENVFVDTNGVYLVAPEIDVTLFGSYDVFDLYAEWVATSLTASDNLRGIDLSAFRWLIQRISVTYQGGTARVSLGLIAETHGEPGVDDTPPAGVGLPPITPWPPININPNLPNLGLGTVSLGAFNNDDNLYRCGPDLTGRGFDTSSPLWEAVDLTSLSPNNLSGGLWNFAVDPYSYNTASIDGWIATGTGIYSIDDIAAASPTLTLRHTFANNVTAVFIDTSIQQQNWVMAIYYNAGVTNPGVYAVYSTNGTSFTEVQVTAFRETDGDGMRPSVYMSIVTAGVAYTTAFKSTGSNPDFALYKSTDHGASWSLVTTPNVAGVNILVGTLHFPWHDNASENRVLWGQTQVPAEALIRTNADNSQTDISPTINGDTYGARTNRSVATCTRQRNVIVAVATETGGNHAIFRSVNNGDSWVVIDPNNVNHVHCHVTDNPLVYYLWGNSGAIALVRDGITIQDKRGNIPADFPGAGTFESIVGV